LILLATNKRDVTTDIVVVELRRRGVPFFRLNTEDIHLFEVAIAGGDPAALTVDGPEGRLEIAKVSGAYYRRPGSPEPSHPDAGVRAHLASEWAAVLRTMWNTLEGRWLNSPFSILRAEDKPRQLAAARRAGLATPDTLIGNSFPAAATFVSAAPSVAKPLRHALIDDGALGSVIFTSRVAGLNPEDEPAVRRAPVIWQREVPKRADVRAIVVDKAVFATRIGSQEHEETAVDWRRGGSLDLAHEPMDLPKRELAGCIAVTAALGLRFSAIDLVEDLDGCLWFLEANPNGQWGWIEQRTGAPIAAALVDALIR
jgi:glutathione synthase/RimK-type ligase-like ATP-grasp enzyme